MLVLISCQSNRQEDIKTVYVVPELNFPNFPNPTAALPLDEKGKRVTDEETPIINVIIPYWYWNLIIDYKEEVDKQETFYKAYKSRLVEYHPP